MLICMCHLFVAQLHVVHLHITNVYTSVYFSFDLSYPTAWFSGKTVYTSTQLIPLEKLRMLFRSLVCHGSFLEEYAHSMYEV